jgi:putative Mg2+ transporter-C (MgtC) family protein
MTENYELVARLLIAAFLGSLIGFERGFSHKAAGLRTHMLVCLGSCLFTVVSIYGFVKYNGNIDPSRIAAQVVSGIGFLGAGSILLRGKYISGITTASSIWTVAAVGLTVGCGMYFVAVASAMIVLLILVGVGYFEKKVIKVRYRKSKH